MKTSNDSLVMAYMTFPDRKTADHIAKQLVDDHLVACVNLLDATSHYRWDNEIVTEDEIIGIAKTIAGKKEQLEEHLEQLHPYDTPCLVFYPADGVLPAYQDWVRGQVTKD